MASSSCAVNAFPQAAQRTAPASKQWPPTARLPDNPHQHPWLSHRRGRHPGLSRMPWRVAGVALPLPPGTVLEEHRYRPWACPFVVSPFLIMQPVSTPATPRSAASLPARSSRDSAARRRAARRRSGGRSRAVSCGSPAQSGTHDRSEAFCDMPPSRPVCAASLRPSMPHAVQASVRIHALYAASRSGPRRSFAGGLRSVLPSTSRASHLPNWRKFTLASVLLFGSILKHNVGVPDRMAT